MRPALSPRTFTDAACKATRAAPSSIVFENAVGVTPTHKSSTALASPTRCPDRQYGPGADVVALTRADALAQTRGWPSGRTLSEATLLGVARLHHALAQWERPPSSACSLVDITRRAWSGKIDMSQRRHAMPAPQTRARVRLRPSASSRATRRSHGRASMFAHWRPGAFYCARPSSVHLRDHWRPSISAKNARRNSLALKKRRGWTTALYLTPATRRFHQTHRRTGQRGSGQDRTNAIGEHRMVTKPSVALRTRCPSVRPFRLPARACACAKNRTSSGRCFRTRKRPAWACHRASHGEEGQGPRPCSLAIRIALYRGHRIWVSSYHFDEKRKASTAIRRIGYQVRFGERQDARAPGLYRGGSDGRQVRPLRRSPLSSRVGTRGAQRRRRR